MCGPFSSWCSNNGTNGHGSGLMNLGGGHVTLVYSIFSGGTLFGNSHLPIGKQESLHSVAFVYSSLSFLVCIWICISLGMGGHLIFSSRQRSVFSQILTFSMWQISSTVLQEGGLLPLELLLDLFRRTKELWNPRRGTREIERRGSLWTKTLRALSFLRGPGQVLQTSCQRCGGMNAGKIGKMDTCLYFYRDIL